MSTKNTSLSWVIEQLQFYRYRYQLVAEGSGVPKRTLEKIARGEVVDPRVSTVEKLAAWLRKHPGSRLKPITPRRGSKESHAEN